MCHSQNGSYHHLCERTVNFYLYTAILILVLVLHSERMSIGNELNRKIVSGSVFHVKTSTNTMPRLLETLGMCVGVRGRGYLERGQIEMGGIT
jgi:hypothetical protein